MGKGTKRPDEAIEPRTANEGRDLLESHHRIILGDLVHKRFEQMNTRELNLIIGILPFSSEFIKCAYTELRKRLYAARHKENLSGLSSRTTARGCTTSSRRSARSIDSSVPLRPAKTNGTSNPSAGGSKDDAVKFNTLVRKKLDLEVGQSTIHRRGVYAMENISLGQFIIEYDGEIIPQKVAD